jgi:hypothetical protein
LPDVTTARARGNRVGSVYRAGADGASVVPAAAHHDSHNPAGNATRPGWDRCVVGRRRYVIAQPSSPLLLPIAHETAAVGVIDDFYDDDFANLSALSNSSLSDDLLAAAEGAFAQRGVDSALVGPAAWTSKVTLLERRGYRTAKLWMLKSSPR